MSPLFVDMEGPTLTAGAGPVDSARATRAALKSQDWGDFAASAGVLALDGLVTAVDPVGTALAAGVGWLMEHFAPLRELLDFVAGDPAAIKQGADTWNAIEDDLKALAEEFRTQAEQQTSDWSGAAKDAYAKQVKEYTEGLEGLSISAGSAAATIATSGTMVATARALIRDIIAAVVAELIKGALAALAGSVVSFGATVAGYLAYAAGRIGMTISKIVTKISQLLAKLGQAGAMLARTLDDMAKIGAKVGADLTVSGAKAFPASPAMAGAATAAGRGASASADGLGAAATGAARASDGMTSAAGNAADAASGLGRVSDNVSGTGLRWAHGADDAGRTVAEGVGKRAQDFADSAGYSGRYASEMNRISNVTHGESAAARSVLGAEQYHEQNYDLDDTDESNSGSYYDGYNRYGQHTGDYGQDGWSGVIPEMGKE